MNFYSIVSPNGNVLGKLSEAKIKRVLSEIYRDIFRSRSKGTVKNFLKYYAYLTWDEKGLDALKNAFKQTKNPSMDHNFPIDFWFYFYEGKYIEYCLHPANVTVITKIKNGAKGTKMPDLETENQRIITIANDMGIDPELLNTALHLFKTNKRKFKKQYCFENCVTTISALIEKDKVLNYAFMEATSA